MGGQEEGRVGEVEGGMVEGGEGQIQGRVGEVEGGRDGRRGRGTDSSRGTGRGMGGRGRGRDGRRGEGEGRVEEEMKEEGGVQVWGEVEGDEEEGMGVTVVLRPPWGRESMKLTMLSFPPL